MTTKLTTIAKSLGIAMPIEVAEVAFQIVQYISEQKIEISKIDHQYLKEVLELSPIVFAQFLKALDDGNIQFVQNSNKNSIEYMKNIIEIYNPSEKVQEETFKKFTDAEIKNNKERVWYHGVGDLIIKTGSVVCATLVLAIVADNKTKPRKFWEK